MEPSMVIRQRDVRTLSLGRPVLSSRQDRPVSPVPDPVPENPVAPDRTPAGTDSNVYPARNDVPDARTKHIIQTLFRKPHTIQELTVSERLTPNAVMNAIQSARGQGFAIKAIPGPPVTFKFEPPR